MMVTKARTGLVCSVVVALSPTAAHAQLDDRTIVSIVRECRKVEDVAARVACYDNIPLSQQAGETRTGPMEAQRPLGFGSEQLPRAADARSADPERIRAKVASTAERERGVYVLTLEDGAQWQFVDAISSSYDPPRRGSLVDISRASLGSYLMSYAGQRSVRIRRIH